MQEQTRGQMGPRKRQAITTARARAVHTGAVGSVLCAGLLVAACAPATSSPPPRTSAHTSTAHSTDQISKTSFVARATTLCTANNDQLAKAAQRAFGNQRPTTQTWRPFVQNVALPVVATRLRGLAALPTPAGDRAKLAAIANSGQAAITAAKHNPQILSPGSRAPFDQFDQLIAAYGIPACVVGG